VPESLAALLEARGDALGTRHEALVHRDIRKARLCIEHFEHLLGVGLPVGAESQDAARLQPLAQERNKRTLDQPPLVMTLLGPWVREKNEYLIKGTCRDLRRQHLDGVTADDAHIGERMGLEAEQQMPDARAVYLNAEVVALGMRARKRTQVLTVAKANFQDPRCGAPEEHIKIKRLRGELNPEARPQLRERALLTHGDAPGAGHERAYRASTGSVRRLVRKANHCARNPPLKCYTGSLLSYHRAIAEVPSS